MSNAICDLVPYLQSEGLKISWIYIPDFCEHLENMFKKLNKTISFLRKLQNNNLVIIYKFKICNNL